MLLKSHPYFSVKLLCNSSSRRDDPHISICICTSGLLSNFFLFVCTVGKQHSQHFSSVTHKLAILTYHMEGQNQAFKWYHTPHTTPKQSHRHDTTEQKQSFHTVSHTHTEAVRNIKPEIYGNYKFLIIKTLRFIISVAL